MFLGFPCGSDVKEFACNAGDLGLIPGLGRSPGERKGYSLQYSDVENSTDSPWGHKVSDTTEQLSLGTYPLLVTLWVGYSPLVCQQTLGITSDYKSSVDFTMREKKTIEFYN